MKNRNKTSKNVCNLGFRLVYVSSSPSIAPSSSESFHIEASSLSWTLHYSSVVSLLWPLPLPTEHQSWSYILGTSASAPKALSSVGESPSPEVNSFEVEPTQKKLPWGSA